MAAKMTTRTLSSMTTRTGQVTAVHGEAGGVLHLSTHDNTSLTTAEARELGKWLVEWAGTEEARSVDTGRLSYGTRRTF